MNEIILKDEFLGASFTEDLIFVSSSFSESIAYTCNVPLSLVQAMKSSYLLKEIECIRALSAPQRNS